MLKVVIEYPNGDTGIEYIWPEYLTKFSTIHDDCKIFIAETVCFECLNPVDQGARCQSCTNEKYNYEE